MTPLVSILMVNYNNARFLGDALRSVLDQDFDSWELIFVENGSTDQSFQIAQGIAHNNSRIHVISLEKRVDIPVARNKGLVSAQGRYIATLDSDDEWCPGRLSRQVQFMEQRENGLIGVCGSFSVLIGESGAIIGYKPFPITHTECMRTIWYRNPFCHSATLIRRSCLEECGHYDETFGPAEDLELWYRIGARYHLRNLPEWLIKYRVWGSSATFRNHRLMVRQTLRARGLGVNKHGHKAPLVAGLASFACWAVQWMPPKCAQYLFNFWVVRQSV